MPRARRTPSAGPSAYQRRINRYLAAHPGATRQEARGHRLPAGVRSEYARRTAGAASVEERAARAGHRGRRDLERWIRSNGENSIVGIDPERSVRDAGSGRWTVVRIQVLTADGRELEYTLRRPTRSQLEALVALVHSSGAIDSINYPLSKLLAP